MKNLALLGLSICTFCVTQLASAEILYMPGNSGIVDYMQGLCAEPILAEGKMQVDSSYCPISYPINLPLGKTIDNVTIAYEFLLPPIVKASIVAYLVENQVDAAAGVIGVGGTNLKQVTSFGPGFINMFPLNVPIAAGNINWVYVGSAFVNVNYVAISYH